MSSLLSVGATSCCKKAQLPCLSYKPETRVFWAHYDTAISKLRETSVDSSNLAGLSWKRSIYVALLCCSDTKSRDRGWNRIAVSMPPPQVWPRGEHMLSHKHYHHHSVSLKMGWWQGQRKVLSPPRYLTCVWTPPPPVSARHRGACSRHRGSVLFTGRRGTFSAGGCKSQLGSGPTGVGTLSTVLLCGGLWIKCAEEVEEVRGEVGIRIL